MSAGCALPVPPLEHLSGGAVVSDPSDKVSLMEWLIGLSATALGGIIAAASSWLTARHQANAARDRWKEEAGERHRNSLREAVAEILASQPAVVDALNKVQATKMKDWQALKGSDGTVQLSDDQQRSTADLSESAVPLHLAVERVRLLTLSNPILSALDSLVEALVAAFKEANVVAQDVRHVTDFAKKQGAVNTAFTNLTDVAQKELAPPPSE